MNTDAIRNEQGCIVAIIRICKRHLQIFEINQYQRITHNPRSMARQAIQPEKQVAELWQRDRAKLDTFAISVQRYSQTYAPNCILGSPYGCIRGNISTLSKRFNTKKLCSRVSSREYQFYS